MVPIAWLSSFGNITFPFLSFISSILKFIDLSRNFSINAPKQSFSISVSIWVLNLNFCRISCTFAENPSKYAIKSAFNLATVGLEVKSLKRNGESL